MTASHAQALGVDIGGTGIKGAPVDTDKGSLAGERYRILTPHHSTPKAVAAVVAEIVAHFGWKGPIGCTFPAVVQGGVTLSAANVDDSWIGADAEAVLSEAVGQPVHVLNDADAAGIAEARFGGGRGHSGVVLMLTFGTGIGSALLVDGRLVPNMELGHLEVDGHDAEKVASDLVRQQEDLGWKEWAKRVNRYLEAVETICTPDLILIGGGASKDAEKFLPRLHARAEIAVATLRNQAGIIGAALAAAERQPGGGR